MITDEKTKADWAALMQLCVAGIPSREMSRDYTLQDIADLCHAHGLLLWLLDGGPIMDYPTMSSRFKMTALSAASLGKFLERFSGVSTTCPIGVEVAFRVVIGLDFKTYRVTTSTPPIVEFSCDVASWPHPAPASPGVIQIAVDSVGEVITSAGMTHAAAKALLKWGKQQEKELRPLPAIHASLDIETWGTQARAAISAIGAVKFTAAGIVGNPFYIRVDLQSCIDAGLSVDPDTMLWWMKQDEAARREVCQAGVSLRTALEALAWWLLDGNGREIGVWGNGWDFDGGRLTDAYAALKMRAPWDYWQGRDQRTLEAEHPEVKDEAEGVAHNALDDARGQAKKIIRLWAAKAPKAA